MNTDRQILLENDGDLTKDDAKLDMKRHLAIMSWSVSLENIDIENFVNGAKKANYTWMEHYRN